MWMVGHPYHIFLMNLQKNNKEISSSAVPIHYNMGAMDLNAKLRNFNML
jgi:hypothetical protein